MVKSRVEAALYRVTVVTDQDRPLSAVIRNYVLGKRKIFYESELIFTRWALKLNL